MTEAPGVLAGHGVRLRARTQADLAAVEAVRQDPVVRRWSGLADEGPAAWVARQRDKRDGWSFAIVAAGGGAALGKVALGHHDPAVRQAELSSWVVPAARGRGLALAACRVLAIWGFDVVGLDHIVLEIENDNEASQSIARRLGAAREDTPPRTEADRLGTPRLLSLWTLSRASLA